MAVQLPPNSTGQVVDTFTTVGGKERQVTIAPQGGVFKVVSTPAAATQASASQAAAGVGVSNVAKMISFSIVTVGTAQTSININLRDGATGAGTIIWSKTLILTTNTVYSENVNLPDLVGTANTAMTLEFSAAGVTASVQSCTLIGYTTA